MKHPAMTVKCLLMACDYAGTADELRGCQNDARNLACELVKSSVATHDDITMLMEPTLSDMRDALESLRRASTDPSVTHVFVSWSGHGTSQPDRNGDEVDRMDECLCPVDFATVGGLLDDELCRIVSSFDHDTKVTLLLDCCHSGTAVDLPWRFTGLRTTERASSGTRTAYHPNVVAISGCRDDQTSADAYDSVHNEFSGAMTRAALDVLAIEPTLIGDAFALVVAMRVLLQERNVTQVPQLCASWEWSQDRDVSVLPSKRENP